MSLPASKTLGDSVSSEGKSKLFWCAPHPPNFSLHGQWPPPNTVYPGAPSLTPLSSSPETLSLGSLHLECFLSTCKSSLIVGDLLLMISAVGSLLAECGPQVFREDLVYNTLPMWWEYSLCGCLVLQLSRKRLKIWPAPCSSFSLSGAWKRREAH